MVALVGCGPAAAQDELVKVRIGHFPNITHAQAVIGHATGKVDAKFGLKGVAEWKVFNAGPSAIEALFANQLDIAVIGPSPAINAYVKSEGEAVRVISGSASGGAALVVRGDLDIKFPEDFRSRKIASPQLGNTQDVSLRSWISASGLKLTDVGGDVQIIPLSNADQQTLFLKKEIDAAWTVEPWVSLLVEKADGKIFLDEADLWAKGEYSTALILVNKKFLEEHRDLVKKYLEVHVELTLWIRENLPEAKKILKDEIEKESGKELPQSILDAAFPRILFTYDPLVPSILEQALSAHKAGFLKKKPDLSSIFDLNLLEEILKEKGLEVEWTKDVK
jgi:NitT/TauT family transport system substrate-binding protein